MFKRGLETPITGVLPCINCGHDLRGCMPSADCPSCGVAVERSVKDDLLRFADARWVHGLRLGAGTMLWCIQAAVGYIVIMFLSMLLRRMASGASGATSIIQLALAGAWVFVRLLWYAGVWRFTVRELGGAREPWLGLRRSIRLLLLIDIVGDAALLIAIAMAASQVGSSPPWDWWALSLKAFHDWLIPVPFVTALLLLWYMRRQVLRAPDRALSRMTVWFMIAFGIIAGSLVVTAMAWPAYRQAHDDVFHVARRVLAIGCGMSALLILVMVAWIVLLIRYVDAFRKSAGLSRY